MKSIFLGKHDESIPISGTIGAFYNLPYVWKKFDECELDKELEVGKRVTICGRTFKIKESTLNLDDNSITYRTDYVF